MNKRMRKIKQQNDRGEYNNDDNNEKEDYMIIIVTLTATILQ